MKPTKRRVANARAALRTIEIPPLQVVGNPINVSFSQLMLTRAIFEESPADESEAAIDVEPSIAIRAEVLWHQSGAEIRAGVRVQAWRARVNMQCTVDMRMVAEIPSDTLDADALGFMKTTGLRAIFPFLRSEVAHLTSQGFVGGVLRQPVALELVEIPTPKERKVG